MSANFFLTFNNEGIKLISGGYDMELLPYDI